MNTNTITNEAVITAPAAETEERTDVLTILLAARYFLPILASIGGILWASCASGTFFYSFGVALICIGYIAAFTVCPLKLLTFPFKCIPVGFSFCRGFVPYYGIGDLIAGLFGTVGGFCFGLLVTLTCPAFFTIKKFLED